VSRHSPLFTIICSQGLDVNAHLEHYWLLSRSGPAAVSNLTVTSLNTSSLSFSWRPSDGHVDIYNLSLYSVMEATANHRPAGSRKEQKVRSRASY